MVGCVERLLKRPGPADGHGHDRYRCTEAPRAAPGSPRGMATGPPAGHGPRIPAEGPAVDGSDTPPGQLSRRARLEAGLLALPPAAAAAAWLWINEPDSGGAVQIGIGMMLLAAPLFAGTRFTFVILSLVIA